MKRLVISALVIAALLIAAGLLLRHHDPATAYTTSREAWKAYQEGARLMQSYRFYESEAALQRALSIDPDLAPAHAALANIYQLYLGHPERALEHLAVGDSLAGMIEDRRGRVLLQMRLAVHPRSRFHAGRDSLLALAGALAPREIEVLFAKALQADMDPGRAEEIWQDILSINPNYAEAYNRLGYLYLYQGRYAEAEATMRRYAFVAPDLANPHDSLGEVLMTIGRYEEAEYEFLRALDKQEDFYFSQMNLARLYLAQGQVRRAVDLVEVLLELFADTALERSFELSVIDMLFDHRLTDLFKTYATRYLERSTEPRTRPFVEIDLLICRTDAMTALARLDSLEIEHASAAWLQESPRLDRRLRIRLLRQRALAAEQLGLNEIAAGALREAVELLQFLPPHAGLLEKTLLAHNLILFGLLDEARALIQDVLHVNPRLAWGLLVAARIETAAGRDIEAHRLLDTLEHALRKADEDFPALLEARDLREELGDPDHI